MYVQSTHILLEQSLCISLQTFIQQPTDQDWARFCRYSNQITALWMPFSEDPWETSPPPSVSAELYRAMIAMQHLSKTSLFRKLSVLQLGSLVFARVCNPPTEAGIEFAMSLISLAQPKFMGIQGLNLAPAHLVSCSMADKLQSLTIQLPWIFCDTITGTPLQPPIGSLLFPQLQHLFLRACNYHTAVRFLNSCVMLSIDTIYIVSTALPIGHDMDGIFTAISNKCMPQSLCHLKIANHLHYLVDLESLQQNDGNPVITVKTMEVLEKFKSLKTLSLSSCSRVLEEDFEDISKFIVQAFPDIHIIDTHNNWITEEEWDNGWDEVAEVVEEWLQRELEVKILANWMQNTFRLIWM